MEIEVNPASGPSLAYTASILADGSPDPQPANNSLAGNIPLAPPASRIYTPIMAGGIVLPPPEITSAPRITLQSGAAGLTPAEMLLLDWQVQDAAGLGLEISAITPGSPITNTSFMPGAVPANGTRYYLTPQHTWQITPTILISPAVSSSLQVSLPTTAEGEYAFTAALKRAAPNSEMQLVAASSISVLAAWSPAVFLHAVPGVYHTSSPIKVELLTAAGGVNPNGEQANRPLAQTGKLTAVLTLNDGRQLSLPSFSPEQDPASKRPLTNARYSLLDQSLAFYGEGQFRVQAAFVNDQVIQNAVYLGLAEMSLQTCSAAASLNGTFRDAAGIPLGGGSPELAQVRLISVLDGTIHNLASLAPDGAYSLPALPGKYLLTGVVLANGLSHQASAPGPIELGCGQTVQLDLLQAAPAVPGLPADAAPASRRSNQPTNLDISPDSSDGLPRPNIYLTMVDAANLGPQAANVAEIFSAELWELQKSNIHLITQSDLAGFMGLEYWRQMTGSQTSANAAKEALDAMGGADFNLGLKIARLGASGYRVEATLTRPDGTIVRRAESDFNQQGVTPQLCRQAASRLNFFPNDTKQLPDLFTRMRAEQQRPILPKLSVSVTPAVVQTNSSVQASVKLTDGNGDLMPGKPISLLHWPPGRSTSQSPLEITGVTNASGEFTAQLPITSTAGVGHVDGRFRRGAKSWCVNGLICNGAAVYAAQNPSSLSLSSTQQVVRQGQMVQVCAALSDQGQPAANRILQLAASGGSLPYGASLATNADGRRCFYFIPGSGAQAVIEASSNNPLASGRIAFQVLGALQQTISAAPSQLQSGAASGVTVETKLGLSPAPGAPASFKLSGPGSLSVRNTTTNAQGKAATVYTAPPQNGAGSSAGSATITSIVFLGAQAISSTITLSFQPAACQAPAGLVCYDVLPVSGITPFRLDDSNSLWGVGGGVGADPEIASWSSGVVSSLGLISKPAFFNYMDVVDVAAGGFTALAASPHPRGQDCSGLCTYALRWSPGGGVETMQPGGSWDRPLKISTSGAHGGLDTLPQPLACHLEPGQRPAPDDLYPRPERRVWANRL